MEQARKCCEDDAADARQSKRRSVEEAPSTAEFKAANRATDEDENAGEKGIVGVAGTKYQCETKGPDSPAGIKTFPSQSMGDQNPGGDQRKVG